VLLGALAAGDVARLTRIPGVGKKTAERLVLELREKAAELAAAPATTSAALGPDDEDILVALVNLGYRRPDAEKALADVRRESATVTVPELLRMALKRLARL
jgi:holliday junction DNA helicase RuvA